jgi:hypothetical protein
VGTLYGLVLIFEIQHGVSEWISRIGLH